MLRRIDLRRLAQADLNRAVRHALPRAAATTADVEDQVQQLLADVAKRGTAAVIAATQRIDGVTLPQLRVPASELAAAERSLDRDVRTALDEAITRVRRVAVAQREQPSAPVPVSPGATVTERLVAVQRVGLYVPGGLAVYPSSVVMNVVPAQVAGVAELAITSPPQRDTGQPHPLVLAAAAMLGVEEVYAVGGAQAVAMFAYGTDECAPVDTITGPGNTWVTTAKRLVRGIVGIDAEAGPTEIAILADETADPIHVAADLISQAEHDPLAASVLITTSAALADAVDVELEQQVASAKHAERIAAALGGVQSATVLVDGIAQGVAVADAYAAEHLEIHTRHARSVANSIRNAGAVFVGPHTPVALGDYCAGSNHVLPTNGCARHSSGLSVQTFRKRMSIVEYSEEALRAVADHVVTLAEAEDLPAHGAAVRARGRSGAAASASSTTREEAAR